MRQEPDAAGWNPQAPETASSDRPPASYQHDL